MRRSDKCGRKSWWVFIEDRANAAPSGEFLAVHTEGVARLYFPLVSEHGLHSWTTPELQGGPAASHHEYLGVPLTAEDLPNNMLHRGFWLVENGRSPFSLSRLSPEGLSADSSKFGAVVNAGLGWFKLTRVGPDGRVRVSATLWCPADLPYPVELMLIEVHNCTQKKLRFDAYAAIPIFARSADNVRDHRHVTSLLHRVRMVSRGVGVCPTMSFDERGHRPNRTEYVVLGFGPNGRSPAAIWPTQISFIGEGRSFAAPHAVWAHESAPPAQAWAVANGKEALGGFRFGKFALAPRRSACFVLLQGIARERGVVTRWTRWASNPQRVRRSLRRTQEYWLQKAGEIRFATPDSRLNNWLLWVNLQPTLRRLLGNSYLPEFDYGRGGKGWRDLWQDCLALLLMNLSAVRSMLLHNFGGVRMDGSNATIIGTQGEFIADRNNIPRTWMDHGCWPTYTTLLYVDQTGDVDFLLNKRSYFRDLHTHRCRRLDLGWSQDEGYELKDRTGRIYRGTVLEHMLVQNVTAFFNVGEHNVCRLEGADWNDGLDMARERGESVAFTAFYAWNLERLADIVDLLASRGIREVVFAEELALLLDRARGGSRVDYRLWKARVRRLEKYMDAVAGRVSGRLIHVPANELSADLRAKSKDLAERIRAQEWLSLGPRLGLFNGYYDNEGKRVEGKVKGRVRTTLTGQVFPLMAGIATPEQADAVTRAVDRWLRDPITHGIRLNTDFGEPQPQLGRAFAFAFGEKENGAVFSHMAVMYAYALYRLRRPVEGRSVWAALYCAATDANVSKLFPCLPEYFNTEGRGMYAYLTGSASWLIYLLLTQVYGVRGRQGDLVLDPQLLADEFDENNETSVFCSFAGRKLKVSYQNAGRKSAGEYQIVSIALNGRSAPFDFMPEGGVRIKRNLIEGLPAQAIHKLEVSLR